MVSASLSHEHYSLLQFLEYTYINVMQILCKFQSDARLYGPRAITLGYQNKRQQQLAKTEIATAELFF